MKLITFTHDGSTRIGVLNNSDIVDLSAAAPDLPTDMVSLLEGGEAALEQARNAAGSATPTLKLDDVKLASPVTRPPKILAVGLNYLEHFYEIPEEARKARGMKVPKVPVIFNKQSTSANGPYDPVHLPAESHMLDYEAELGVVIGKRCRRVAEADAFEVVAGYTILNDVTIRDWQQATPTMTMGKSWDTHCPMGPALVTRDELADPHALHVRLTVDGEERQNFNTKDMHFKIAQQIAHLSTAFTLVPGDVIATGTSAGVAMFMPNQPWLQEGQTVRVEIEGLGHIENQVVADDGLSYID